MKKLVLMLMLAVFSLGAYAQTEQGESSVGFNVGCRFGEKNASLGVDYRYSITDAIRINPSFTYFTKNDGLSACALDLNAHYLVKINSLFGFYPLAGLDLSFWKYGDFDATRFGANIGLGGEFYLNRNFTLGADVKYNIIKDLDQCLLNFRFGYTF